MAGTFSNIILHIVFSTKDRKSLIRTEIRTRLHDYLGGIVRGEGGVPYRIGGTADHVHLLIRWRTDESVATLLRNMKSKSSKWMKDTFEGCAEFQWQAGYGVFSVSQSQSDRVESYIRDQEKHHSRKSFQEEFIALLNAHRLDFDKELIWK